MILIAGPEAETRSAITHLIHLIPASRLIVQLDRSAGSPGRACRAEIITASGNLPMKKEASQVSLLILILSLLYVSLNVAEEPVSVINLMHRSQIMAGNDLGAALSLARDAVKLDPAYADAWKQLGRVLMLRREYPEAITSLETALELKQDDQDAPVWILGLLMELDRTQAAQLAGRWEKTTTHAGLRRVAPAIRLMTTGNLAGAETTLRASSVQEGYKSMLALAWTHLGTLFLKQHKTAKAIEAFQQALKVQPNWTPALRELGWAYRMSGKPAQAVGAWEQGLEQNPSLMTWVTWIAEARSAAKEPITTSPAIQRLLQSEPSQDQGRILKLALLLLSRPGPGPGLRTATVATSQWPSPHGFGSCLCGPFR